MWKLDRKLIRPAERRGLRTGKVGQPMHKVEGNVGRGGTPGDDEAFEGCERGPGGSFALHEPPVIEAEPTLCKLDRPLLLASERGKLTMDF